MVSPACHEMQPHGAGGRGRASVEFPPALSGLRDAEQVKLPVAGAGDGVGAVIRALDEEHGHGATGRQLEARGADIAAATIATARMRSDI